MLFLDSQCLLFPDYFSSVNLYNKVFALMLIIIVALHITLPVLSICEGFSEWSMPYLTCTVHTHAHPTPHHPTGETHTHLLQKAAASHPAP